MPGRNSSGPLLRKGPIMISSSIFKDSLTVATRVKMAFTKALYYPHIEIPDQKWLKTAILYWDTIQTITPASIERPYTRPTDLELLEAGVLSPIHVYPDMAPIRRIAGRVLDYLESPEAARFLQDNGVDEYALLHPDKFPELERLANIHPDKLPFEINHQLERVVLGREDGWLQVHPGFASFYMTLLATELSTDVGAGLLTEMPSGDQLSTLARLDCPRPVGSLGITRRHDRDRFEERMPGPTAQAILAEMTLRRVAISGETPVSKILKFRDDHKDELGRFRTKLGDLTKSVEEDLSVEALQQRIADTYSNEVVPAVKELEDSLSASKIKWAIESFMKTSFLSVPAGSGLMLMGLSAPHALLAAMGISITASTVLYNEQRREKLRQDPFTYLLAAEKQF